MNDDIKNGKSGKKYTVHQSGGLDFILTENTGVELEVRPMQEMETPVSEVDPQPFGFESHGVQEPLEFNFGP